MPSWIGIDPGYSGGIAVIANEGDHIRLEQMPRELGDLATLISELPEYYDPFVTLEQAQAMPLDGKDRVFTYGRHFGHLEALVWAHALPLQKIRPAKWQKEIGIKPKAKGQSKLAHKKNLLQRARELYPRAKVTLATADALLLAHYGSTIKGWGR